MRRETEVAQHCCHSSAEIMPVPPGRARALVQPFSFTVPVAENATTSRRKNKRATVNAVRRLQQDHCLRRQWYLTVPLVLRSSRRDSPCAVLDLSPCHAGSLVQ